MKTFIITCLSLLVNAVVAFAVPAYPYAHKVALADGTSVTLRLVGDEYSHFTTTGDGYTVVADEAGNYCYAQLVGNKLMSTGIIAHDEAYRDAAELQCISGLSQNLRPVESAQTKKARRSMTAGGDVLPDEIPSPLASASYDYSKFKGLIILAEWSDCSFSSEDINAQISAMVNTRNYKGYTDSDGKFQSYTGSVKDYFYDNSNGQFSPDFDIVGPVKIDCSCYEAYGTENITKLARKVLAAADPYVDYSKYDANGDGQVDMFYIIYAGYGSNYTGNNSNYIWPAASSLNRYGAEYDGEKFGRFACSTEFYGWEQSNHCLDGIGTIVHEFSHVLGLPDLYDTDGSTNGDCETPYMWDVMCNGSYYNKGRTPAGYSGFERYAVGFATPDVIEDNGQYVLENLQQGNRFFKIASGEENENFIVECRSKVRWDQYLPGEGMLIWRIDSTSNTIWSWNMVNAFASHPYVQLVRANATRTASGTVTDSENDPFPGKSYVTSISNTTTPSLLSWTGKECDCNLRSISYEDGRVSFTVSYDDIVVDEEDFESMSIFSGDAEDVAGSFCNWTFVKSYISEPADDSNFGSRAVAMRKGATLTTSQLEDPVESFSFDVENSSSMVAQYKVYYSVDNGATWTQAQLANGTSSVNAHATDRKTFAGNTSSAAMYRITETVGSASSVTYIDNIKVEYADNHTHKTTSGVETVAAEENITSSDSYNVAGMKVDDSYKGLVIVNGKKYLRR